MIRTLTLRALPLLTAAVALVALSLRASSFLPSTTADEIAGCSAIFRGNITALESYQAEDGGVYTRATIRVDEVFKGKVPGNVLLVHRGGTLPNAGEANGFSPNLKTAEERLFLVARRADGTLFAARGFQSAMLVSSPPGKNFAASSAQPGDALLNELRSITSTGSLSGADVTDQSAANAAALPAAAPAGTPPPTSSTATNLLVGGDGLTGRSLFPDRGEGIPYLIDAQALPAGMTLTQAVGAVQTAMAAWTNATSVRFVFAGFTNFGVASPNITASDGVLRIQLHDLYHYIGGGSGSGDTLGEGGLGWSSSANAPGWTIGGNVAGNDFHKTSHGYVVLAHTNVFMQNLANFTEVLCHEIGHTMALAHSSENFPESNPILSQAIMYFQAHGGGRGATLNSFDTNVARQVYPLNTPPYCYDRFMDVVTAPGAFSTPGVNVVQLRGYDLQNTTLALATVGATANNGTFSVTGTNITYTPAGYFPDSGRLDPAGVSSYDIIYFRFSDGVNASPYSRVRVLALYADSSSEGIPDSWRTTYFGNSNPNVGSNHHALNDADGDGYNNVTEWRLGSVPTDKTSNLKITSISATNLQFQAKPCELYELQYSTNLTNWARALNPIMPTNATANVTGFTNSSPRQFFRVVKIP